MSNATIHTVTISKADIPNGGMKSYKQDDDSIILITRDEDEFSAFDGKCPHAGADLGDGLRCGNRVICPWHHGSFDSRDGTLLEPVAMRGLTQYELTDEGDSLIVNTAAKIDKHVTNDKMTDTHTIIVGGGGAGFMTANQLRHTGYGGKITLISQDDKAPYNRPLLSKMFLAGKMDEKYLMLGGANWASNNNIDLRLNQTVSEVLPNERTIVITDADGKSEQQTADFLVVATGAEPKIPPFKGAELDGVYTLRSMDDAKEIKSASDNKHVVIVGTGFIGMEVASALMEAGKATSITVVGRSRRVMANIVSEAVSNALIKLHEEKGVNFVFGAGVDEINAAEDGTDNESTKVSGVTLSDGSTLAADMVILGTGVAPRIELLNEVNAPDGVQVDEHLQLRDGVYALGDIAKATNQMGRMRIEHWRVALQHGLVTAAAILNEANVDSLAERIPFFWTAQYGKSLRYSGHAATPDNGILFGSPDNLDYIEYYFDDDGEVTRASAASSLGRDKELIAFSELLRRGHAPTRAQIKGGFDIIEQAQVLSR
ncbi:NADPH-dependent 2,4-dienoyl-CoA reductase/sulfur reductase-like enzyme/nitrite reductase/ring-hydroxylating ferredoxin subunit [Psychrobacter luti]|uniref:NADPH-dependent 2,4-dienoyl-CoA reductase/sulfur reductase-like enzyme/nitrite reductase/ring-hydroxylating ferredoxin subunit n=1 Tax=Psychrobacter luti TaxID=198481 RepID=A0A839TGH5_9GAMM|nr:FAD-dependent oxidoreductase [Psychrobacter luti]MBB3107114.1 NADPH-dependent 2,4-dienoyl-CoA reductase/sulfur reductase-like enzyme/nitrite reductase/ring-hydroxylating ferredoxin subunit [Psychrobacter luti]